MWQKAPKLRMENSLLKVIKMLFFNNKGQVAQITVHKHKSVSAKWYEENMS